MNTPAPTFTVSRPRFRLLALLMAVFVASFAFALPASAAVEASFDELGPGYSDVISGEDAGSIMMTINGQSVKAFCIQMNVPFNPGTTFTVVSQSDAGVSGLGSAAWIARNHASTGTPLADPAAEDAAAQVAIWTFTDGATVDDTTVASPSIRARALELAAAAGSVSNGAVDYSLSVEVSEVDGVVTAVATVLTGTGGPVEGTEVTFDFSDGTSLTADTNASGVATAAGPASDAVIEDFPVVSVDASATLGVPAGAALLPGDGSQILILGQGFNLAVADTAEVELTVPDDTTTTTEPTTTTTEPTTPTTVATPTTVEPPVVATTTPPVDEVTSTALPHTGGNDTATILFVGGGLALVALAGLAWRKSRTNPNR